MSLGPVSSRRASSTDTSSQSGGVLAKKPPRRRKDSNIIWFWGNDCKYSVITDKAEALSWKVVDEEKKEGKCNLFWVDVSTIHERLRSVLPWQIVNHFPGMTNIARKNRMGQNLNKFQKLFPREYNFFPRTWVLPGELHDFRNQFDNAGNSLGKKVFILKPDTGCQGKGIFLTMSWDTVPTMENWVAQVYMKKPLLVDGFKFDLRIYVMVTCVKPLRMYLFQDGLVRICAEEYVKPTKANIHMTQMHLTNYAVNKNSANFVQPGEAQSDDGSKRALSWFMDWIREDWGDSKADRLWRRIGMDGRLHLFI
jgi:tubulin polyglutamylase TTLL6/13